MKKLFITLTFLILSACAQDKNNTDQATVPAGTIAQQQQPGQLPLQQQRYPYQYNYDGANCVTGQKHFRTRERYCDSLRNNVYNNNCAVETRYEQFRTNCTDRNWQYRR
jgi:hypothetical protein